VIPKGTRGQGFKGSSEILKNYKEEKDMEEPKIITDSM
jgi:hypothetical protein